MGPRGQQAAGGDAAHFLLVRSACARVTFLDYDITAVTLVRNGCPSYPEYSRRGRPSGIVENTIVIFAWVPTQGISK